MGKIYFGDATLTVTGIGQNGNFFGYDQIEKINYYNIRRSLNGMPTSHDFEIKLKLKNKSKIKIAESADIRPASMRIPISKIFKGSYRKQKKQEIQEEVKEIQNRFSHAMAIIIKMTGISPNEKIPYF